MGRFVVLAVVGLAAQLIDGALGMAYGVTSSTLLLWAGSSPVQASASVHLAEVGTTLFSGLSHSRLGNIDWPTVRWIALPGAVGAFAGAYVLTAIPTEVARPWMSALLLLLGLYVLLRFALGGTPRRSFSRLSRRALAPLGLAAGFIDATGGGGWGPVTTPTLLASGRMSPRKVVGSVDASEFLVALSASAGFLLSLGKAGLVPEFVIALLVGGAVAAPLAAWLVRFVPPRVLGSAVGGLIVLTNGRTLSIAAGTSPDSRQLLYLSVVLLWLSAIAAAVRWHRREDRTAWGETEVARAMGEVAH
jgi:uncharacterized membrane protein YfcA